MQRRIALLKSPPVVRACRQFWDTLRLEEDATLERSLYEEVHRLLTSALAPEMSEDEWREAAAEDWTCDLRGESTMRFTLYLMSIFEVGSCPRAHARMLHVSFRLPICTPSPRCR